MSVSRKDCHMKYNAVIFDFDGTIAYTSKDVWGSIEYAAGRIGSIIPDAVKNEDSNLGLSTLELFKMLEPLPPMERFDEFDRYISEHYRTITMYPGTFIYPGMEDLIKLLIEKKIPRYIVTMKPKIPLERILQIKKWDFMFDGWYTPDYIEGKIYSKEELLKTLISTKLKGYNCVYIGDSYSDVIATKSNNLDCIGVTYGDGDKQMLIDQKPTYVFDDINRIIELFI